MPAATPIWPPGARYRISCPIRRQAVRSARRTSRRCPSVGGEPSGSRSASVPSPISSNTPSARSTWTGHRWSSPRSPRPTRVARPARAAGSASPANWPNPRATMCPAHLRQADSVIKQAPGQGEREQPGRVGGDHRRVAGIDQPHLPNGLAGRLPSADSSIYVIPGPDELAERAAAVVEAAGWFRGRPDEFAAGSRAGTRAGRPVARMAGEPHPRSRRGRHGSPRRSGSVTRSARSTPVGRHPSTLTWPSPSPSPASPTKRETESRPTWPAGRTTCGSASHAGDALVALGDPEGAARAFRGRAEDGRGERRLRSHGRGD